MRYRLRQLYATTLLLGGPSAFGAALSLGLVGNLHWWAASLLTASILTIYGYNVGIHHAFTHRLFVFPRPVEVVLVYLSTVAACASPFSWAVLHNAHHRYAETEHDPHSPTLLGWKAILPTSYRTTKMEPMTVRHLMRDPVQQFANSELGFWTITLSWPLTAWLLGGGEGLVWLWLVPLWYALAVAAAFVFTHTGKPKPSRAVNSWVLSVLSFGDGAHLDHHEDWRKCGAITRGFAKLAGGR